MYLPKLHLITSVLAGIGMAIASAAGVFSLSVYVKESAIWAAQGTGQDIINLFLVFPTFLILTYFVSKGSLHALLVWLGTLIYIAYSYVLYSFFVTFGPLFLVYVATLGCAFYAIFGTSLFLARAQFTYAPPSKPSSTAAAIYLFINGLLFAFLWLLEIFSSLRTGTIPPTAVEVGFVINPVHVLDLGFILPAMIAVALLLKKKHVNGYIFAIPVVTFAILMASAILGMIANMHARGLAISLIPIILMSLNILIGIIIGFFFLRSQQK
ncbi:MAG: hypothetical protein K0S38_928 [Candidatus Paceibacter sp.]|jgi:hypothetical protein|nr:hypothetical protein [Candidatus Paceibacter sp.]